MARLTTLPLRAFQSVLGSLGLMLYYDGLDDPTIAAGSGAPDEAEPAGSIRVNVAGTTPANSHYFREGAAWLARNAFGSAGIAADVIAESTAAAGVTVDGVLLKDGSVQSAAIVDPGDAGAISVSASGVCALTSAGAETRTLAIPAFLGERIALVLDTDGGNLTLTVAAAFNEAGNNTLLFDDPGEFVDLVGVSIAGALVWRVSGIDGATPSTV